MKISDAGMFFASTLITTAVATSSFLGVYFLIAIPKEVKRLDNLRVLPKEQKQVEEKPMAKAG